MDDNVTIYRFFPIKFIQTIKIANYGQINML